MYIKRIRDIWNITNHFWYAEGKWKHRLYFLLVIISKLSAVGFLVLLNAWTSSFYNALQNYNSSAFMVSMRDFFLIGLGYVAIRITGKYLEQYLELQWRVSLTESFLTRWLDARKYYYLELGRSIDNPDQRISEDLNLYVMKTMNLFLGIFESFIKILSFGVILWRLSEPLEFTLAGVHIVIPGYLCIFAVIYAVCGTLLANRIGRPLIKLNYMQQKTEADFRYNAIKIRDNAESIVLYRGEAREKETADKKFSDVAANYLNLIKAIRRLNIFSESYSQFTFIFPFLVAAPQYFIKKSPMGTLVQTATAFDQVQRALSYFISSYHELAEWSATAGRIIDFHNELESISAIEKIKSDVDCLMIRDLRINLPDGKKLLRIPGLFIQKGENLHITGANGQGKTVLGRVIAGSWPFIEGTVIVPDDIAVLPQKPYMPDGSLKDILCYPGKNTISAESASTLMRLCYLEKYIPLLDKHCDFEKILSEGEKELLILAQTLWRRPSWILLDEPTAALDKEMERKYYEILKEYLPDSTLITISHSKQLESCHSKSFIANDGVLCEIM